MELNSQQVNHHMERAQGAQITNILLGLANGLRN